MNMKPTINWSDEQWADLLHARCHDFDVLEHQALDDHLTNDKLELVNEIDDLQDEYGELEAKWFGVGTVLRRKFKIDIDDLV